MGYTDPELIHNMRITSELEYENIEADDQLRAHAFCGREEPLSRLQEAVEKLTNDGGNDALFIEAAAGMGKTALVESFLMDCLYENYRDSVRWGRVKLDEASATGAAIAEGPFQTVGLLLENLLQPILNYESGFRERLEQQTSPEDLRRLSQFVPCLSFAASAESSPSTNASDTKPTDGTRFGLQQLVESWRNVIRVITESYCVVLVLDDLQWLDETSFEFLEALAKDSDVVQLLLLATLRNFDNAKAKALHDTYNQCATDISLKKLSKSEVSRVVNSIIPRLRQDEADPLSDILLHKTGGNPFFLLQYVYDLTSKRYIYFDSHSQRWKWDGSKIKLETDISDNVLELVTNKLTSMRGEVQKVIAMAAFLGRTCFEVDMLLSALRAHQGTNSEDVDASNVLECLVEAAKEGFVEEVDPCTYKFSHDQIREGAQCLLDSPDKAALHLAIGRQILAHYRTEKLGGEDKGRLDKLLFTAVRHCTAGLDALQSSSRTEVLDAIVESSEIASAQCCFYVASDLLEAASNSLDAANGWHSMYERTLDVKTRAAKASYCCGRHELCEKTLQEIIANARNIDDSLEAHQVSIQLMDQQQRNKEAVDETVRVLEELGVSIPKSGLMGRALYRLWKLKKTHITPEEVDRIASAHSRRNDAIVELLLEMSRISMGCTSLGFTLYSMVLPAEIVLKQGSGRQGGSSFMGIGCAFSFMGDIETATRFGQVGEQLSVCNTKYPIDQARARVGGNFYVMHWTKSYHQVAESTLASSKVLMACGRVDVGLLALLAYIQLYIASGLNLAPLKRDIEKALRVAGVCSLKDFKLRLLGLHHFISQLTGDNPLQEDGHDPIDYWIQEKQSQMIAREYSFRVWSSYLFGDVEKAEKFDKKYRKETPDPDPFVPYQVLFQGLIGCHKAKRSLLSRNIVSKAIQTLEGYCKIGSKHTVHMLHILKAEQMTTRKHKSEDVKMAFDEAIRGVGREGILSLQALANERAGIFYLNVVGDKSWAKTYLSRAQELYSDWGAKAKADHMIVKFGQDMLEQSSVFGMCSSATASRRASMGSSSRRASMGHRSRPRMSVKMLNPSPEAQLQVMERVGHSEGLSQDFVLAS